MYCHSERSEESKANRPYDPINGKEHNDLMPDKLYLLRMNPQGTQVHIEECGLADYPVLDNWFKEKARNGHLGDPFKEWELVGRVVGDEQLIRYTFNKEEASRDLFTVSKTLKEYHNCVEKAEQLLRVYGNVNVRHEESKENIALCSFSDTYYVYEKPFLKLVYRLGNRFRTDSIFTEYDIPCWKMEFFHQGGIYVHKRKESINENKSFEEWMQQILREPDDAIAKREHIIKQIATVYGSIITKEEILYDPAAESYFLKEDTERSILEHLLPVKADDVEEMAKYTSFEGLVAILESGKIRLNSIVSMNDKTETDFLGDVIRNYKEEYEQEYDKYLFADKEFITSFTSRIDDLDLWRLYGDNARGVCLVFERDAKKKDELYKIRYIDPESEELKKIGTLMDSLNEKGIRFRLNLLQKCRHFLKHADYQAEEETRLLMNSEKPDGWFINRENGILTPYVEKTIRKSGDLEGGDYPFRLRRIILGPSIRERYANLMQVFYLAHQQGYFLSVAESRIQSYR